MLETQIEKSKEHLQVNLAKKAEILDSLEKVNKEIENAQLVLQVLQFAQQEAVNESSSSSVVEGKVEESTVGSVASAV